MICERLIKAQTSVFGFLARWAECGVVSPVSGRKAACGGVGVRLCQGHGSLVFRGRQKEMQQRKPNTETCSERAQRDQRCRAAERREKGKKTFSDRSSGLLLKHLCCMFVLRCVSGYMPCVSAASYLAPRTKSVV